jgi:hypothetical protein
MEEDQWWLMPYVDSAVKTLSRPRNWVDPVLWPEGWIGNQQGQGDFRLSDLPTSLLGLGRFPEPDEAYRSVVRPALEFVTDTSAERTGRKAAAQGGEAERRQRAIRAAHEKPKYVKSLTPAKDAKPEEEPDEDDYMNQLLMSALMAGGKATGRQAPSSYGVGAQVPFGDPWVMRRQWEQDYRNIG